VGFHALTDRTKLEMYALNQSNPDENTYSVVAERYGVSQARAKAVLYLMNLRDAKQRSLLGDDRGILSDAPSQLKHWMGYLERYKAAQLAQAEADAAGGEATETVEAAASTDEVEDTVEAETAADDVSGDAGTDAGVVATEVPSSSSATTAVEVEDPMATLLNEMVAEGHVASGATLETLGETMTAIEEHLLRLESVVAHEAKLGRVMNAVADAGYSTTFKEVEGAKGKTSLEDTYFPDLFKDREEESVMRRLQRRIEADTKASVEMDVDIRGVLTGDLEGVEEGSAGLLGPSPPLVKTPVEEMLGDSTAETVAGQLVETSMNRWKIAFRDLSRPESPTMIRTRKGGWRRANALEELKRSWVKRPAALDIAYHGEVVQQYMDPDGDEEAARAKVAAKHTRRKALLATKDGE